MTIKLEGKAAEEFARSIFFPTKEETEKRQAIMDKIDKDIKIISEDKDGFTVECKNLDLSFLQSKEGEIDV